MGVYPLCCGSSNGYPRGEPKCRGPLQCSWGRLASYVAVNMHGAPDTIRTCDLCLRRATLYPAELRVRGVDLADHRGIGNAPQGPASNKMADRSDRPKCHCGGLEASTNYRLRRRRARFTRTRWRGCSWFPRFAIADRRSDAEQRTGFIRSDAGRSHRRRGRCRTCAVKSAR